MTVEVVGLKMYQNIGTMFMQAALVQCICLGCNSTFAITLKLLSLRHKLLQFAGPCPRCRRDLKIVLKYELLYKENLSNSGTIAYQNIKLTELKGVAYAFTCMECDNSYIQKTAAIS